MPYALPSHGAGVGTTTMLFTPSLPHLIDGGEVGEHP